MKIGAIVLLLLIGCAATPVPLAEFHGWAAKGDGADRFHITVGEVRKNAWNEALLYAASFSIQRGYGAFTVKEEDGKGESGTFFFWNQSYDGRSGLMSFAPGKYFTITCRKKRPNEYETWFDAATVLRKRSSEWRSTAKEQ